MCAHYHAHGSEEAHATEPAVFAGTDGILATLAEAGLAPADEVGAFRGLIATCPGFVSAHTQGLSTSKAEAKKV